MSSADCRRPSAEILGSNCGFAAIRLRVCPDDARAEPLHHAVMFGSTYAVSWESAGGKHCAGRLDMDGRVLTLTGAAGGCDMEETIPFEDIDDVRIKAGRLEIRRRNGCCLEIGSLDAPGALREVVDRLVMLGA